jgi:hypothetical protein
MSQNSNAFYSVQYASAVELLSQQMQAKIANTFSQMTAEGKAATVVDQIDTLEADERTTRYDDIIPGDPVHTRPWVFPRSFDKAVFFDTLDKMRMNANPTSQYVNALLASIRRKQDDESVRAFYADRLVGENGTTTESFVSGNQISVSAGGTNSGLNVEKLQLAIQKLEENEVDLDMEQLYCVITPRQKRDLMNEIEVTSGDFFKGQVMSTRSVSGFLAINFIVSNRLPVNGSSHRRVPLYTPKAMTFCAWDDGLKTDVSQRKDKRGLPWQAYVQGNFGAVRSDPDRIIEIPCVES